MTNRRFRTLVSLAAGLVFVAVSITPAVALSGEGAKPPLLAPGVQHTTLDDLHLVGAAVKTQRGNVRLVNHLSSTGQVGAAYTDGPVSVGSFTETMTFHIKGSCSDGIAMIVQDQGHNALGGPGGDIGYGRAFGRAPQHGLNIGPTTGGVHGINHSVAFMLDSWGNSGDPVVPYLGMQTRGPKQNDPRPKYSLASTPTTPVNDGLDHTLTVQYDGTTIQVTYDGTELVDQALDVSTLLGLSDGTAYLGVTAANGGCMSNIAITAFDVTS